MSFTFVNKNLLIPEIKTYNDYNSAIKKLLDDSYVLNNLEFENIYVVALDSIYFTDSKEIYKMSNPKCIEKINFEIPNENYLQHIKTFLNSKKDVNYNKQLKKNDNLFIKFNHKKENDILIENNKETKPKTSEELELIKLCETTMELYQNEVSKMKDLEKKIKILEHNKINILKKEKEKIFQNFSKFKNDYQTFQLINKKKEKNPDFDIPSLFELKYVYFKELTNNEANKDLLEKINNLNLDNILNTNSDLDEDIKNHVNNYGDLTKKLNVKFSHSWEDLEYETESMETNNSRFNIG